MEQFIVDYEKVFVTLLAVFAGGGVAVGLTGRKVLKRLLSENGSICPITERGKTPLTKEDHAEMCAREQRIVLNEINHVKENVDWIRNKMED